MTTNAVKSDCWGIAPGYPLSGDIDHEVFIPYIEHAVQSANLPPACWVAKSLIPYDVKENFTRTTSHGIKCLEFIALTSMVRLTIQPFDQSKTYYFVIKVKLSAGLDVERFMGRLTVGCTVANRYLKNHPASAFPSNLSAPEGLDGATYSTGVMSDTPQEETMEHNGAAVNGNGPKHGIIIENPNDYPGIDIDAHLLALTELLEMARGDTEIAFRTIRITAAGRKSKTTEPYAVSKDLNQIGLYEVILLPPDAERVVALRFHSSAPSKEVHERKMRALQTAAARLKGGYRGERPSLNGTSHQLVPPAIEANPLEQGLSEELKAICNRLRSAPDPGGYLALAQISEDLNVKITILRKLFQELQAVNLVQVISVERQQYGVLLSLKKPIRVSENAFLVGSAVAKLYGIGTAFTYNEKELTAEVRATSTARFDVLKAFQELIDEDLLTYNGTDDSCTLVATECVVYPGPHPVNGKVKQFLSTQSQEVVTSSTLPTGVASVTPVSKKRRRTSRRIPSEVAGLIHLNDADRTLLHELHIRWLKLMDQVVTNPEKIGEIEEQILELQAKLKELQAEVVERKLQLAQNPRIITEIYREIITIKARGLPLQRHDELLEDQED